jgi:hypothetical protein
LLTCLFALNCAVITEFEGVGTRTEYFRAGLANAAALYFFWACMNNAAKSGIGAGFLSEGLVTVFFRLILNCGKVEN